MRLESPLVVDGADLVSGLFPAPCRFLQAQFGATAVSDLVKQIQDLEAEAERIVSDSEQKAAAADKEAEERIAAMRAEVNEKTEAEIAAFRQEQEAERIGREQELRQRYAYLLEAVRTIPDSARDDMADMIVQRVFGKETDADKPGAG